MLNPSFWLIQVMCSFQIHEQKPSQIGHAYHKSQVIHYQVAFCCLQLYMFTLCIINCIIAICVLHRIYTQALIKINDSRKQGSSIKLSAISIFKYWFSENGVRALIFPTAIRIKSSLSKGPMFGFQGILSKSQSSSWNTKGWRQSKAENT